MGKIEELDQNMKENIFRENEKIRFHNLKEQGFFVSGLQGFEEDGSYDRLNQKYRMILNDVNPNLIELGSHTAGGQISFRSNTKRVVLRVKLSHAHNMSNMTPIGQCGFDCYVGTDRTDLNFLGVTKFDIRTAEYQCELVEERSINAWNQAKKEKDPKNFNLMNEFLINFPLYCHVEKLEIGLDQDAVVEKPSNYSKEGKLIFYGTSITQGGCATRPGTAYTNMLARALNVEQMNFGFSGNGLGEYEVADMMAEIGDPMMYVIDYEANSGTNGRLIASLEGFVGRLREKHEKTPIVILSRIPHILTDLDPELRKDRETLKEFQKAYVTKANANQDQQMYFIDGTDLFPREYGELTIDMVHPSDLGFYFMAERLTPILKEILHI